MPTFRYEIQLGRKSGAVICGVDEAGLRSLAGPVVACAAILPLAGLSTRLLGALDDSKRLSAEVREAVAIKLRAKAIYALGEASVEEIDRFNILRATFVAMRRRSSGAIKLGLPGERRPSAAARARCDAISPEPSLSGRLEPDVGDEISDLVARER